MSPKENGQSEARQSEAPATVPVSTEVVNDSGVITKPPVAMADESAPTSAPTLAPPSLLAPPTGADLPPEDVVQTLKNQMIADNEESPALRFGIPDMPFPRYPYAKGPDLANDGVGYGEVLRMTVYRANGRAVMAPTTGYSRRTRSGRQVISENELTPEIDPGESPAPGPSAK